MFQLRISLLELTLMVNEWEAGTGKAHGEHGLISLGSLQLGPGGAVEASLRPHLVPVSVVEKGRAC